VSRAGFLRVVLFVCLVCYPVGKGAMRASDGGFTLIELGGLALLGWIASALVPVAAAVIGEPERPPD
jgi:hypothetical protein